MKLSKKTSIILIIAIVAIAGVAYGLTTTYWWHQNLTVPTTPIVGAFMSYNENGALSGFSNPIPWTSNQSTSSLWQWNPASNSFNAIFYIVNMGTIPFNFSINVSGLNSGWGASPTIYGMNCTLNLKQPFALGYYREVGLAVFNTSAAFGAVGQQTGDFKVNVGIQY